MSDTISDAEKIRNKRLAKLGGNQPVATGQAQAQAPQLEGSPSNLESTQPTSSSLEPQSSPQTASSQSASQSRINTPPPASTASTNPFSQLGLTAGGQQTPKITITPRTATLGGADGAAGGRSSSQQGGRTESTEQWEDKTLSGIFRVTLKEDLKRDLHGHALTYVPGVVSELEGSNPPRLSTGVLEQAIIEAASSRPKPLEYLLACWKRVTRLSRTFRRDTTGDPKYEIIKEARRLCMSYCILAVTTPELFEQESTGENQLAEYLLNGPDEDNGICHDFLTEAVSRFSEDDTIKDALVGAMEQLSGDLSRMSMNDSYKPYITALRNYVRYPPLVDALTESPMFLPSDIPPERIEHDTLLGPFFNLSPLQGEVAINYFTGARTRDESYVQNSQKALRMTLQTHQDELFDIANCIIKAAKDPRGRILNWFALTVNANHKRRATYVDPKNVSSDGFMVNITVILDRLCEPFMDATFSKVDRIDADYLRRSPRVDIEDETKMNAEQKTSDEFYSHKAEGTNNFISEVFFLTVAAHHYGTEAANTKLSQLQRDVKHLEKQVEKFEMERHKFASNPTNLRVFESHLKKYKDRIEQGHCVIRATQGVLLDELSQARSMQFMRYVIVWMLRVVSPGINFPKQKLKLPLPEEQPQIFKCLPEYFLEDVVDNFKFITRSMPWIITSTQCEELVEICITFLRSSEYIKNPYLKSGLVTILFHGVWPIRGKTKGVLGDLLNGSDFSMEHLLHALMKFYIEAESTGTHTQFFDKFNIRYEIFQVIKCIWSNPVYQQNLATEAKVNLEFFVRFVNLLLNDVTFVLDESFSAFNQIHSIHKELRDENSTMDAEQRTEKEESLASAQGKAKSYMQLTNETVEMLKLFTEALADSFTMPEIVQRLADMLDYNLEWLVGPKQRELKVENPEQYGFDPRQLLSAITDVYINLKDKENFQVAVARDGRSYKPQNFTQAANILSRFHLKSPEELQAFNQLATAVQIAKEADEAAEEDFEDAPDEFNDPIMGTPMLDPVILPVSKNIVDRSTIKTHLLSDPTDPFNRVPMRFEDVIPATELKARIDAFVGEKRAQRMATISAASAPAPGEAEPMDTTE